MEFETNIIDVVQVIMPLAVMNIDFVRGLLQNSTHSHNQGDHACSLYGNISYVPGLIIYSSLHSASEKIL